MDKVNITMTMCDEFGSITSLDKYFDFFGNRGFGEADQILCMVESFLDACEFKRVREESSVVFESNEI